MCLIPFAFFPPLTSRRRQLEFRIKGLVERTRSRGQILSKTNGLILKGVLYPGALVSALGPISVVVRCTGTGYSRDGN